MESFDGQVAVITGAASGIGRATARLLAAEGARLVLADIERPALDDAVAEMIELGARTIGHVTDVSHADHVEALAERTVSEFGGVNIIMNNAGVAAGGTSWEIDLPTWEWVIGVDLWSVVHGIRSFVPRIIASGGGHVINTASMAGVSSMPFMGPYNVSKHAVVTLSETMYHELAMLHPEVGVTVVCPGWVKTQINRSERNRPESTAVAGATLADLDTGELDGTTLENAGSMVDDLIANGLDPDDVAALVVEAVRHGRFYVLTHPEWMPMVSRRVELMLSGNNPEMSIPGLL